MYYGLVLTVIDVAGRVFMRGSWIYLKDCRQLGAVTEERGELLSSSNSTVVVGVRRAILVLELECKCGAVVAACGLGFRRLGGR